MSYILAIGGVPFTDRDAAEFKRMTLEQEVGGSFSVVNHPDGGYAVMPGKRQRPANSPSGSDSSLSRHGAVEPGPMDELIASQQTESAQQVQEHADVTSNQPVNVTVVNQITSPDSTNKDAIPEADSFKDGKYPERFKIHPTPRAFLRYHLGMVLGGALVLMPHLIFSILLPGLGATDDPTITAYVMAGGQLMGLVLFIYCGGYFTWWYVANRYIVSLETVETERGVVSRKIKPVDLDDITTWDCDQSIIERILNVGHLKLATSGTGDYELKMKHVLNPKGLLREIQRRAREFEKRKH